METKRRAHFRKKFKEKEKKFWLHDKKEKSLEDSVH
jgi:hypothetical protein